MEQDTAASSTATGPTKVCKYCRKEIPKAATRCPHCQGDQRGWVARHPVWTAVIALAVLAVIGGGLSGSGYRPSAATVGTSGPVQELNDKLMAENSPTIKELGTLPVNYIGKSFSLFVYVQADRYYNYGFADESQWYSVRIWDSSANSAFDDVYAYLPRTAQNAQLVNAALNGPVFAKVEVTVPADKWQDGSNAFLEVTSWSYPNGV
ncbi:MAG: hypothetical protein KGI03_04310 [Patescibacteria group bacterium]|nr:hypothetical protein [Patescibacteria group bacterium]